MTNEEMQWIETIGETVDTLTNLLAATEIPMPAQFHLDQLREAIPDVIKDIKEAYINITGENPWD